jgi:hypothetical protein
MGDSYAANAGARGRHGYADGRENRDKRLAYSGRDGVKGKDLLGIPWMLAFALRADGWYLRSDIIWAKPNAMPESIRDRPSKAHEYMFLLAKEPRYFYDGEAVRRRTQNTGRVVKPYRQDGKNRAAGDAANDGRTRRGLAEGMTVGDASLRSVWTIPVGRYKHAHFATFPRRLVVPCVSAGTSERGCCPACLAPWVRIVKKNRRPTRPGHKSKVNPDQRRRRSPRPQGGPQVGRPHARRPYRTVRLLVLPARRGGPGPLRRELHDRRRRPPAQPDVPRVRPGPGHGRGRPGPPRRVTPGMY